LSSGSTYEGALCIYNNSPLTPLLTVPITLQIPAPQIDVLPTGVTAMQLPDLQGTRVVTLSNGGNGTLTTTVTEGSSDCSEISDLPWLAATPITGTLLPGTELPLTVQLDSTGLSSGSTHEGALCIYNNTLLTPILSVPVTLQVPWAYTLNLPLVLRDYSEP
ncbi:MAG: hypothetical protein RBT47_09580, partial [Anaerolineae bacterium]|nr:hypothetical protein [Anaerolineae bacterium]